MSYWIVDRRDKIAQKVTEDAYVEACQSRFVKVQAETVNEAFSLAGVRGDNYNA